jgi:hypothetical protein
MNKTNSFIVVYLDLEVSAIKNISRDVFLNESNIAGMAETIDTDSLQKLYKITDDELKLRNGLLNGILNNIIVKKLK